MLSLQETCSYRKTLLALVAFFLCFSLLRVNQNTTFFVNRPFNRPGTNLGTIKGHLQALSTPEQHAYSNARTLDIVVSMYKEDTADTLNMINDLKAIAAFQGLQIQTYVYTKDLDADVPELQRLLNTSHVSILRNVGREAGTYFTHILREWDNLARHTMFIQAEMHEYEAATNRIRDWFEATTGVLSLGDIEACNCVKCEDMWDSTRTFPRIEELYSALNGEFCPKKISMSYSGQVIVSAERIRARGRETYKYLKTVLEADMEHFIHDDPRQDMFDDKESNPYFGHTIERSYLVLWDCASERIAKNCGGPGGLHARRTSDMESDYCQCLDRAS